MGLDDQSGPQHALAAAFAVLAAPLGETLPRLSTILAELLPHRALAVLTGDCTRCPLTTHGETTLTARITSAELARLAGTVDAGAPRFGQAVLAGTHRRVLAVASAPTGSAGALLAVIPADHATPCDPTTRFTQEMWDLITLRLANFASAAHPAPLAGNRAAANERAKAIGELTDAHATTLTALLGTLRSRALDDAAARRNATDIAVSALIDLRAAGDRDRALSEETAGDAFARLADKLNPLTRYSDVSLELVAPEQRQRSLPADVANTARAVTRGTVLAMLEQDSVDRIRVAWQVEDTELRIALRDDGPGTLTPEALTAHRLTDRLATLGGTLTLDAIPDWGTAITATLPLAPPDTISPETLATLNPRELDVLEQLAKGHRNRKIAEQLHITEHTVKFHVANILHKLSVSSRGEAAAIAHNAGPTPNHVSTVS
jgi:DNA-binding CsgD family transcriptional regulator